MSISQKTRTAIGERLAALADDMEALGVDLDYFGGLNAQWHQQSVQMLGASYLARQWAAAIIEEAT